MHESFPIRVYAALSLLFGTLISLTAFSLQDATEGALVLAGIAYQPNTTPIGQYFFSSWTLLHQLGAALLFLGLDQDYLELIFNALPLALRNLAAFLIILHFSKKPLLALILGSTCVASGFALLEFSSPDYPITGRLGFSVQYTYGVVAYSVASLVIALILHKAFRLSAIVCGILVSIHIVIGLYMSLVCFIAGLACLYFSPGNNLKTFTKGYLLGLAISALSLGLFVLTKPQIGPINTEAYAAYLTHFDGHRIPNFRPSVIISGMVGILLVTLLLAMNKKNHNHNLFGYLLLLLCVLTSYLSYATFHFAYDWLPIHFISAMPNRFPSIWAAIAGPLAVSTLIVAFDWVSRKKAKAEISIKTAEFLKKAQIVNAAKLIVPLFLMVWTTELLPSIKALSFKPPQIMPPLFVEDRFWTDVRELNIRTPVLTSYHAASPALREGHLPVLISTRTINFLGYIPEASEQVADIITTAYGVNFYSPPSNAWSFFENEQPFWNSLSLTDWRHISSKFRTHHVIAPSPSKLNLKRLVEGDEFTLFEIQ